MTRSELIKNRLIECSNNNELELSDEIEILQHLFNKLHMVSVAEAAKRKGVSYNGMKLRIESGREILIHCGNTPFISAPQQSRSL